ncbi:MAG: gluconokinase [Planctomycetota bacterium]|nr:gluconokinase [Planctomycetota bacterium]
MIVVLMGVCGCGKSTVGEWLARKRAVPFYDGDKFHPPENVEKMRAGIPLTDADRRPWLGLLNEKMRAWNLGGEGRVAALLGCSALRRAYRERLSAGLDGQVFFLHLHGSKELLAERMGARRGHYMPPGLLDSQLATLEPPGADEFAAACGIEGEPDEMSRRADGVLEALGLW